eukprot:m.2214 g.2214  ORF g.2214 m.2214 type:complete len:408 (-) comp1736_c0_seq2:83-1306(-)
MSTYRVLSSSGQVFQLKERVGFDTLPDQFVNRERERGFCFNIAVIGETGVGKSSLMDSLFNVDFDEPSHMHMSMPGIEHTTRQLREGGVELNVTITSTIGYGDQINRKDSFKPLLNYIDTQYDNFLQEEMKTHRDLSSYEDTRVHVCIMLLPPTGTLLKSIDLLALKELSRRVNVVPVIAKADTITPEEMEKFKHLLQTEFENNLLDQSLFQPEGITNYPFAVIGSQHKVKFSGNTIRARQYPWGLVEVENENHSDFLSLRNLLLRTHLDELRRTTHSFFFERYRQEKLQDMGGEELSLSITQVYTNRVKEIDEEVGREKEAMVARLQAQVNKFNEDVRERTAVFKEKRTKLAALFIEEEQKLREERKKLEDEIEAFNEMKEQEELEKKKKDKKGKKKPKKSIDIAH